MKQLQMLYFASRSILQVTRIPMYINNNRYFTMDIIHSAIKMSAPSAA